MARSFRNKQSLQLLTRVLSTVSSSWSSTCSRSLQTLAYEEVRASPSDKPVTSTAFVLHGLLGCGTSWRAFSRSLASSLSDSSPSSEWRMVLVDLRNHAKSAELEGFDPPHDMYNAAKDLANLVESQGWRWPHVVIGHSLGCKVVLQFAESCRRGDYGNSAVLPKQVWVLDSAPGEVTPENSDGGVEILLEFLLKLPPSIPSRKWLVNLMLELGFPKPVSEWIGSNLRKSGDQETWAWTFNLDGAIQMFSSYREASYWSLLEQPPKAMELAIVRAEKSDWWEPEVVQRLESLAGRGEDESRGKFSLHHLPNSGHWVHIDNPKGLIEIMTPRILSL